MIIKTCEEYIVLGEAMNNNIASIIFYKQLIFQIKALSLPMRQKPLKQ
jgi:hypothetical protein